MPKEYLLELAETEFGLNVNEVLPIGESFASDVVKFASGNRHYVIKRPFSYEKAVRESHWLKTFSDLTFTPNFIEFHADKECPAILMSSLKGMPLSELGSLLPSQVRSIGQMLRQMHDYTVESFDGCTSWHELLINNAKRYTVDVDASLQALAQKALNCLEAHLSDIPDSRQAVPVHFDFRPGNILALDGHVTGVIDFESMRGGHASMDFFKLAKSIGCEQSAVLKHLFEGYGHEDWMMDYSSLTDLYQIYHGLGGLAWCGKRRQVETEFYRLNKQYLQDGIQQYC